MSFELRQRDREIEKQRGSEAQRPRGPEGGEIESEAQSRIYARSRRQS